MVDLFYSFRFKVQIKFAMDPSNETLDRANLHTLFREPITKEIDDILDVLFNMLVNPILCFAGVLLNIINMIVFYKMSLPDGITQNFFILSLTDSLYAFTSLVNKMALIARTAARAYIGYGDVSEMVNIVYQASFFSIPFPQNYSLITTVVIAVVRCCCVAMPLKVKYLLTVRRQLAAILFLSGITTIFYLYVLAPLRLIYLPDPGMNTTIAYFIGARWSANRVFNNAISFGGFAISIVCVVILSTSLSTASKFRDTSTASSSTIGNDGKTSAPAVQSRERQRNVRVVRTVLLVTVIFIVCNVPTIFFYVLKGALEGFVPGGRYEYSNSAAITIGELFVLINTCLNTFIYFFYNNRYRQTLNAIRKKSEVTKVLS